MTTMATTTTMTTVSTTCVNNKNDDNHYWTPYRDNATDILPVRLSASSSSSSDNTNDNNNELLFQNQIIHIVQVLCPFLKPYKRDQLSVIRLCGGLSNELFVVRPANDNDKDDDDKDDTSSSSKAVLVRIHPGDDSNNSDDSNKKSNGDSTTTTTTTPTCYSIVDRNVENAVSAWLSAQHVGPIHYGRFVNGRVEEFYPHHAPLSYAHMSLVGPTQIAPIMARFHSLPVPATVLINQNHHRGSGSDGRGDIFQRVHTWMRMAQTAQAAANNPQNEQGLALFKELQQEWTWLENALLRHPSPSSLCNDNDVQPPPPPSTVAPAVAAAQQFFSEIVFTHMDMQSLNLLRNVKTTSLEKDPANCALKVIDFEYAGWNPRGIDIANTFCEHCDMNHIKAKYDTEYPSDETQNQFLQTYLQVYGQWMTKMMNDNNKSSSSDTAPQPSASQQPSQQYTTTVPLEYSHDPVFLQTARQEIGRYTLVSHLSWAIWSIVQSHVSEIDFDYIQYAQHRMEGYQYMKERFFSCDTS